MAISVQIFQRNFVDQLIQPNVDLAVELLIWAAIGGPDQAQIGASGGTEADIWNLVNLLRCPIEIYEDNVLIWWGLIETVRISVGSIQVGVSLDDMANRLQVTYTQVNVAGISGGRASTTWLQDDDSVSEYGTKENLITISQATDEQALSKLQTALAGSAFPVPDPSFESAAGSMAGAIECCGWWSTMGWEYYADTTGKEVYETSKSNLQTLGAATANAKLAGSLQLSDSAPWQAQTVRLHLKAVGAPADNLVVKLCADAAGVPGTVLATATLPGSSIGANLDWAEWTLGARVQLALATTYWITAERSGAPDSANYFQVEVNEDLGYPRGVLRIWNGGAWVARSPDADLLFNLAGVIETSAQISNMISSAGQFFTGLTLETNSGVFASPYQSGDSLALACVEELLASGTSNSRRMLVAVDRNRWVRIYEQPVSAEGSDYLLYKNGDLHDGMDNPLPKSYYPAGVWARLKDVLPGGAAFTKMADPTRFFIEESTYDVNSGRRYVIAQGKV